MKERPIAILLFLLPLLAACQGNDPMEDAPDAEADSLVTLAFRFIIPSLPTSTRGTWTDENGNRRDDGEDTQWENYINIPDGDYRFYVLDTDNRYLFALDPATEGVESVTLDHYPTATAHTYEVRSRLLPSVVEEINRKGFRIMMLANWRYGNQTNDGTYDTSRNADFTDGYPTYAASGTAVNHDDMLHNATFTWNHKPLSETHTIPMYGILTVEAADAGFVPGEMLWCKNTLHLLRALVKIEVCLSDALAKDGYTLTSCWLQNYNTVGYYNPHMDATSALNDADNKYVLIDTQRLFESGKMWLHAYNNDHADQIGTTAIPFEYSSDGSSAIIYTPEFHNNLDNSTTHTTLKDLKIAYVEGKETKTLSYWESGQEMKEIDAESFKELHRNHYYQIIIQSVSANGTIEYTVCNWDKKTPIDIGFE